MRIKLHIIIGFLACICLGYNGFGQKTGSRTVTLTLPQVSLLDIEPTGDLSFSFTAPGEAGNRLVDPLPNATKWLNYTSAIPTGGGTKTVTASISTVIPGINIKVKAGAASGSGAGTLGGPSGQVILSTTGQTIISGIGGAYTGNGINNGHQLTISVVMDSGNYSLIKAQSNTEVIVIYTLSPN